MGLDGDEEPYVAYSVAANTIALDRHSPAGWSEQTWNIRNASHISVATDGLGHPWVLCSPVLLQPSGADFNVL